MTQAEDDELKVERVVGETGYESLERNLKHAALLLRPENARRLAAEHADYAKAIQEPGRELGPRAGRGHDPLVRIWSESLSDGADLCHRAVRRARRRLERADNLELVSEIVAATSSSGLIGLIYQNNPQQHTTKLVVGAVTLAGTWAALIARSRRRVPGANLVELYAKLVELAADAVATGADLRVWHAGGGKPPDKGDALGDKARKVAVEIEKACALVGET